jgi:hypothetical protein
MPPNPNNVDEHVVLSEDYHDEKSFVDFYTNSAMAIGRDREDPEEGVWLDSLEKRALFEALADQLGEIEDVTVKVDK